MNMIASIRSKRYHIRTLSLLLGLFLYALGIVISMNANIGYAPWEVFHAGIAHTIGMTIGNVSIIAGLIIGGLAYMLGEKIGFGTLLNMVLIGIFMDLIIALEVIPRMDSFLLGTSMLFLGMFIISLGSFFYIGAGLGAGPRDSLMVAIRRKSGLSVGISRIIIEISAVTIGWLLGGMAGIGTLMAALGIGFCVQTTFKLLRFDVTKVKHEDFSSTLANITGDVSSVHMNGQEDR